MGDVFVGCEFGTYKSLEEAVTRLIDATGSRMVKGMGTRSASCHNSVIRAPHLHIDEARLRYSFVSLICPRSGCPFGLKVKACPKRQALVVVSLCLAHSHAWTTPSAAGLRYLGSMALRESAFCGDLPAVRTLLAAGYQVDASCPATCMTPLHWAAVGRQPDAARLLLQSGADPLLRDADGRTPRGRARDPATQAVLEAAEAQEAAEKASAGTTATLTIAASSVAAPALPDVDDCGDGQESDTAATAVATDKNSTAASGRSASSSSSNTVVADAVAMVTMRTSSASPPAQPSAAESALEQPLPPPPPPPPPPRQQQQQQQIKRRSALTPFEIDPERHLSCPRAGGSGGGGHTPAQLAEWRSDAPKLLAEHVAACGRLPICCWQCAGALLSGLEAATGANLLVTNSVSIESYAARHPGSGSLAQLLHLKYAQLYVLCDHSPRMGARRPTRLPCARLNCPFQLVLRARPMQRILFLSPQSCLLHTHPIGGPANRLSRRVGFRGLGAQRFVDIGVQLDVGDGGVPATSAAVAATAATSATGSGGCADVGVCFDVAGGGQQRSKSAYPVGICAQGAMRIARFMTLGFRCSGTPGDAPQPPQPQQQQQHQHQQQQQQHQLPAPPRSNSRTLAPPGGVLWSSRAAGFPVRGLRRAGPLVTVFPGGRRPSRSCSGGGGGGGGGGVSGRPGLLGLLGGDANATEPTWDMSTDDEAETGTSTHATPHSAATFAAAAAAAAADTGPNLPAWVAGLSGL